MHLATRSAGWVSALIFGALAAASACGGGDDDSGTAAMNDVLPQNGSGGSSAMSGSGGSSTTSGNPTTGGSGGTSAMHGSHDAGSGTGSGGSHAGSGGADSGLAAPDAGSTCFSPTQNLDTAYEQGSVGCACKDGDPSRCVQGVALICNGTTWDAVEDGPCDPGMVSMRVGYSNHECEAAGGVVVFDPGDGRLLRDGCPDGHEALGIIDNTKEPSSGIPVEGALCCECATQGGCAQLVACGAHAGAICKDTEFCGYVPGYYCGGGDAEAVCRPRPSQCTGLDQKVCGCDQKTYDNACAANVAGTGVNWLGTCSVKP